VTCRQPISGNLSGDSAPSRVSLAYHASSWRGVARTRTGSGCERPRVTMQVSVGWKIPVTLPESATLDFTNKKAGGQGFEPRMTGPEPAVMPFHHPPVFGYPNIYGVGFAVNRFSGFDAQIAGFRRRSLTAGKHKRGNWLDRGRMVLAAGCYDSNS
jgi:hypothetical protein